MIITRTPFRVSFLGGGTDFPAWYREHGGAVISTTINKYSYIHCRKLPPFFDYKHKVVFFSKQEEFNEIKEIQHPAVRETYSFMKVNEGLVIQHDADLPSHSGLASSSAFTVGLLHALYALQVKIVTKKRLALEAIHIEQEMINEAVGSQDQVAVAFGGLNRIDFSSNHNIEVTPLTIGETKSQMFQDRLMLFFTGFVRFAAEIEQDKLKNLNSRFNELKSMHSMVDSAVNILNGDTENLDDFGKLLHETWIMKKSLSTKVSNGYIDDVYKTALNAGALGGKILGAGGGGFILFYVKPEYKESIKKALDKLLYVPFRFDTLGSQVIYYSEESV
jgi:D-glycero-alpha-D-manno-heptose-7-phosphate kinase